MSDVSPHLPPKSCSRILRERIRTLPVLLLIILLAVLSGVSASLVVLVWVVPQDAAVFGPSVYRAGSVYDSPRTTSLPTVKEKLLRVYAHAASSVDASYTLDSYIGDAVVLTSDGWAALYYPTYKEHHPQGWQALDSRGQVHTIVSSVFDDATGVLFVRWSGDDFRAISFLKDVDFSRQEVLFQHGELWKSTTVSLDRKAFGTSFDSLSTFLSSPFLFVDDILAQPAAPLMSSDGQFIGFIGQDRRVVSSHYIDLVLPGLLQSNTIVYYTVPVSGTFVEAVTIGGFTKSRFGFVVTLSSDPLLLARDVVVAIDGKDFSVFSAGDQLILSSEKHILTVVRSGSVQTISVGSIPIISL